MPDALTLAYSRAEHATSAGRFNEPAQAGWYPMIRAIARD